MTDDVRTTREAPVPLATGMLGMRLLLAALGMLFAASIVGFVVTRSNAYVWPPPGVPSLPATLWVSTVLILLSSVTMEWARRGIAGGNQATLSRGLLVTLLLTLAFLASQTVNWFGLVAVNFTARTNLYGFLFYLLTGLHAAHVLGGLVPLATVAARGKRGAYSAESHAGVTYTTMYWHFLTAVWLVLFVVLLTS